jgi:hypothetical protein
MTAESREAVLDCASPLALWISVGKPAREFTVGCFLPRRQGMCGPVLKPMRMAEEVQIVRPFFNLSRRKLP